jgi:hypothetical protein
MKELVGDVSKCFTFYIEQQGLEETKLKDIDTGYLLSRVFERIARRVVANR